MDKIYSSIKLNFKQRRQNIALFSMGLLLILISLWLVFIYMNYYQSRFYPKTYIDDVNVSGLNKTEAKLKIQEKLQENIDFNHDLLKISFQEKSVEARLLDLGIENNLDANLEQAFTLGHQDNFWRKIKFIIKGHFYPNKYYSQLSYDREKVQQLIEQLKNQVDFAGKKPELNLINKRINIDVGQDSTELLIEETWEVLQEQVFTKKVEDLKQENLNIQAVIAHPILALTSEEVNYIQQRAEKVIDQKLILNYEYQKVILDDKQLLNFIALPDGIDQEKLTLFIDNLKTQINRPSRNATFTYDQNTLQVTEFIPDQDGLEIDSQATKNIIENFLNNIINSENKTLNQENTFTLPMTNAKAEIALADTNNLGIKEVIGFGESWYDHSIPNRIDNVALTASRINNYIVKPNQEFSFNVVLGEVSDKTGYKNAYIIEAGETKLAPGGGVCQVSSTLFRSLLNAGVKITRRLPHAYRVSYYEIGNEPGFDATVYTGSTDLRFINDTPAHILISCQADSENLYMFCKLYGTNDGRSTEIVKYRKWGQTPALPTVYIPDASLRPGQLKQIDWSASGIKAEFTNVIRDKNGETIREDYYYSSYRPWAAKFLQGI